MHPYGGMALNIDFERRHWCTRVIRYDSSFNSSKDKRVVEGDAILFIDLEQNPRKKYSFTKLY
jgi:hypothetical protein